jgi:ribosomal protein L24E
MTTIRLFQIGRLGVCLFCGKWIKPISYRGGRGGDKCSSLPEFPVALNLDCEKVYFCSSRCEADLMGWLRWLKRMATIEQRLLSLLESRGRNGHLRGLKLRWLTRTSCLISYSERLRETMQRRWPTYLPALSRRADNSYQSRTTRR